MRFSDLVTRRELHRLDLYREVYRPLGVEYQIAFTLPASPRQLLGISLSRATRDFTAIERDLLTSSALPDPGLPQRSRPHAARARRRAADRGL